MDTTTPTGRKQQVKSEKAYILTVTIPEGNDEFWEAVGKLNGRDARRAVRDEIQRDLAEFGFDARVTCAVSVPKRK